MRCVAIELCWKIDFSEGGFTYYITLWLRGSQNTAAVKRIFLKIHLIVENVRKAGVGFEEGGWGGEGQMFHLEQEFVVGGRRVKSTSLKNIT